MKLFFLCMMITGLMVAPATAQTTSGLVYQRDKIVIEPYIPPKPTTVEQARKNAKGATQPPLPIAKRSPVTLSAEIRHEDALRLDQLQSLSRLRDKEAVALFFRDPIDLPLMPMQIYNPLDVLFVDANGIITQMVPEVVLSQLQEDLPSPGLTKAYVFLKAGSIEKLQIEPEDRLVHPLFVPALQIVK